MGNNWIHIRGWEAHGWDDGREDGDCPTVCSPGGAGRAREQEEDIVDGGSGGEVKLGARVGQRTWNMGTRARGRKRNKKTNIKTCHVERKCRIGPINTACTSVSLRVELYFTFWVSVPLSLSFFLLLLLARLPSLLHLSPATISLSLSLYSLLSSLLPTPDRSLANTLQSCP